MFVGSGNRSGNRPPAALLEIPGLRKFKRQPSCVYFLCLKGEVVYVGETTILAQRINSHTWDKKFDTAFYISVPAKSRKAIEAKYIQLFKPRLNGQFRNLHMAWERAKSIYIPPPVNLRNLRVMRDRATSKASRTVIERYIAAFPNKPDLATLPDWLRPVAPAESEVAHA